MNSADQLARKSDSSPVSVHGLRCVRCLDHFCQANRVVDGEALCIWCLDSVPCPARRKPQPGGGRTPLRGAGAQSQGGSPALPRKLSTRSSRKTMATATASPKTNGHQAALPPVDLRACKCGCNGRVPSDARFSYLPGHMKRHHQQKSAAGRVEKPAKKKRGRPRKVVTVAPGDAIRRIGAVALPGVPPGFNLGRVTLEVTEPQLDRFLTGLPLSAKQTLANYYLSQLDAL